MTDEIRDNRLTQLVRELDQLVPNARSGLPMDLFYLVSRLTPMVNVDLLIESPSREVLLTWREDPFYNGWHVPGGIIRFKETAADRIRAVALEELGAEVDAEPKPLEMHEKRNAERDIRGHFISLLYRCRIVAGPARELECTDLAHPRPGQWAFHASYPERMISQHAVYRHLFQS